MVTKVYDSTCIDKKQREGTALRVQQCAAETDSMQQKGEMPWKPRTTEEPHPSSVDVLFCYIWKIAFQPHWELPNDCVTSLLAKKGEI